MKSHTSLLELILIMALLVGCLPLFTQLIIKCQKTEYIYMSDKSLVKKSSFIEYEPTTINGVETLIPKDLRGVHMPYAAAMALPYVQDDYVPDEGKVVLFDFYNPSLLVSRGQAIGLTGTNSQYLLSTSPGYKAFRIDNTKKLFDNNVARANSSFGTNFDKNRESYLIWNYADNCWVVSFNTRNIYIQ